MRPEEAFLQIKKEVEEHRSFLIRERPSNWEIIDEHQLWLRGESKAYPETISSLGRELKSQKSGPRPDQEKLYQIWVYTKVRKFLYEYHRDLFEEFSDSWNYPFFMQHYGIPSCFIDFTPSIEAALFFATQKADKLSDESNKENWPVLWLFDPSTFNYYERNKNNQGEEKPHYVGAPLNGNFYNFMVFGGEWGDSDTYKNVVNNARDLVDTPNFQTSISSALSPHSYEQRASSEIRRMYSQTGYFFYSKNQLIDLTHIIYWAFNRAEARYSKKDVNKIDARLLKKIKIPPEQAKLIQKYLTQKGFTSTFFGLDDKIDDLVPKDFCFENFLLETEGGFNFRKENAETFIKRYIAPLEVWLD